VTKLIFLDFDGVIVVPRSPVLHGILQPEPSRVRLLAWIVRQTGADIVISSCWRHNHSRPDSRARTRIAWSSCSAAHEARHLHHEMPHRRWEGL
jgi:hypothetical protein